MNEKAIRIGLIQKGLQLKDLARLTGIDYDRMQKVVHGYRAPKPEELAAIATALGLSQSVVAGDMGTLDVSGAPSGNREP